MKASSIIAAVEGVTQKWTKQRKREEREASARLNRSYVMVRRRTVTSATRPGRSWGRPISTPPRKTRCQPTPGRSCTPRGPTSSRRRTALSVTRFDQYFTQQLLPDYIEMYGETLERRVRRARPFPGAAHRRGDCLSERCKCGSTLRKVRGFKLPQLEFELAEEHFPTLGPRNRYGAVLFVEKEEFHAPVRGREARRA